MPCDHLSVLPPLLDWGCAEELEKSGRTLHVASSPLNESLAVYPASSVGGLLRHQTSPELLSVFAADGELVSKASRIQPR
jgi:hypothetical protein